MKKNIEKFIESLDLDQLDEQEKAIFSRRVTSYSVDALKAAAFVDRMCIKHTAFARAVQAMDRIFQLAPEMDMPHGMILQGPTGTGKTAAFRYFRDTLPSSSLFAPGDGAIGMRCPKRPRVGHFVSGLLKAYRYPFSFGTAQQLYIRRGLVFDAIRQKGTRLIFLDEAAGLMGSKKLVTEHDGDTDASEFLREIVDECRVGLVLAGPQDMQSIGNVDRALASRLSVHEELKLFGPDAEWVGMVRAFVKECKTFDLQFLNSADITRLLHMATDGNLRSLKRLVIEAILIAIDAGRTSIDRNVLVKAQTLVLGSASQRPNVFA